MSSEMVTLLKDYPFFKTMTEEVIAELVEKMVQVNLKPTQHLFHKGDQGDALYILTEGRVKMVSSDNEGKEMVLNQLGPVSIIGEMALLDDEPRSAGVIALDDVVMLRLSNDDFHSTLMTHPESALEITRGVIGRLRFATTYLENAINWSQHIAKGDYSFIDDVDATEGGEALSSSDKERARRFMGAFLQMVRDVKAREDTLRRELQKLKIEIDENKRQKDVDEIASSEFFQNLRKQRGKEE